MLGKMEFCGITGPVLNWTAAFFKNRVQRVVVDGRQSRSAMVDSGMPQGTVLGHCCSCCSGTCMHWSCGVIHGACASMPLNVTLCKYCALIIPLLACIHCATTCSPRLIQPNILASTCPPSSAGPPTLSV